MVCLNIVVNRCHTRSVIYIRTKSGYFIELNGKNIFIIHHSYYLKDKLLKTLLMRYGCNYDQNAIKGMRAKAKRAQIGIDNLGNYVVKIKGGTFTHIDNISIVTASSFNLD